MNKSDVSKIIGESITLSAPMESAFTLWAAMYENRADWLNDEIKSMGLASSISGEIARMVTAEMEVRMTGGARADWLSEHLKPVITKLKNEKLELGLSRGGVVLKPYVTDGKMAIDFVTQDNLYPVKFDGNGNMTSVVFLDSMRVGDWHYTRLEYHQLMRDGLYLVQNYFYRSREAATLGSRVAGDELPDVWADIDTNTGDNLIYFSNIEAPLYGFFRFPSPNNVDPNSPLGVSCFSNAQNVAGGIDLIKQADKLWSNLIWEFESGKRAIYVDPLALDQDTNSKPILPDKRLYRVLSGTGNIGEKTNLFSAWSPEFREEAINSGLNSILKRIEFNCRLAYGTLSDPQTVDKTATEIITSKQRSYVTVTSTQEALESAINGLLYAMDTWATLFNLAPAGTYSPVYEFDDSVITNKDAQYSQDMQALDRVMSKVEFRMRNYREDEPTAKKMLALLDAERQAEPSMFGDEE